MSASLKARRGLRASPVSWLGGFMERVLPAAASCSNDSLQCPALCCFRLTVARRRRLVLQPLAIQRPTVFPCTKPAVIVGGVSAHCALCKSACITSPAGFSFTSFQDAYSWPPIHSLLDHELRLKNLFQQIALIHARRRAHTQTLPFLHEHHLIGVLSGQI